MTRTRLIAILLLSAVLMGIGLWAALDGRSTTPPPPSSTLLVPATTDEIRKAARELHGALVLVNFWASWCGPCKDEFPEILKMRAKFADRGLRLLLVSVDETRDFAEAEGFLKAQKVDFPTYYKGAQSIQFMAELYPQWTGAVPTNLLLGPDLRIVDAWEGQTSGAEFESRILKQLGKP